ACSYLSRAGRAIVLATASAEGLRTDSCGAALAHVAKKLMNLDAPGGAGIRQAVGDLVWQITPNGADRATSVIDPSSAPEDLPGTDGVTGLPLAREDGSWKIGIIGVEEALARSPDSAGPELARFRVRVGELLVADGWILDGDGPSVDGKVFLGSFAKPTVPGFAATVEFILESGPTAFSASVPARAPLVVGGEFGVRHLQTAQRLRALGLGCDTNVSFDVAEFFEQQGLALPEIEDEGSADQAAVKLAAAAIRHGEPFAREHSSLNAMIEFVEGGGQTTRDEMFEAIFVPVAMAASGRTGEAADAIDRYRARMNREDDRQEYEALISRFGA
ncbi:MAG: hypothetical protein ACRDQ1_19435, partial [Sciscionella sp.]